MTVKLLIEQNLEFLSLKGGCTGSSESTLVKNSHCWKSHIVAQIQIHLHFMIIIYRLRKYTANENLTSENILYRKLANQLNVDIFYQSKTK